MSRLALGLLAGVLIALCVGLGLESTDRARAGLEPGASAVAAVSETTTLPAQEVRDSESEPSAPAAVVVAQAARVRSLVHGTLFDSEDAPIAAECSANVSFVDRNGRRRSSTAKEAGAYALTALDFGSYWVTARAEGYRTLEERLELSPKRASLRRDFTLQKAVELRIRVVTPDRPSALVAIATREPPGERCPHDPLSLGSFRGGSAAPGCIGVLQLEGDLPVFVSLVLHQVVLGTLRVESAIADVEFVLSPEDLLARLASIRVFVLDAATRAPFAHAQVMLHDDVVVETDAQGSATLAGCEPGRCELQIRARGFETLLHFVDASPGLTTEAGTVALEREIALEGRVLDAAGTPHAAAFSLGVLAAPGQPVEWLASGFESRADGTFKVPGLGRRQYVIRSRFRDTSEERSWRGASLVTSDVLVDTRGGDIRGLELRVVPAAWLVVHAANDGAQPQRFRVLGALGLEIAAGSLRGSQPRAIELPPGDYRVILLDSQGRIESERPVTLGPD